MEVDLGQLLEPIANNLLELVPLILAVVILSVMMRIVRIPKIIIEIISLILFGLVIFYWIKTSVLA